MDDITRPWRNTIVDLTRLDGRGKEVGWLAVTLIPYLMELRKIFVRKLRAICTSLSDGIFCATISTIFIFLNED